MQPGTAQPPSAPPTPPYAEPGPYVAYPPGPPYPGPPTAYGGPFAHPAHPAHPGHLGYGSPGYVVVPYPPRPRSTAARIGLFVLRAVLACVPLATIGLLSWVPLIRTALVRRRPWDWAVLIVTAVAAFWAFVAVGSSDNDNSFQTNAGMGTLLFLALGSTVYFLVFELRTPPSLRAAAPQAAPPLVQAAPPLVPLGQVQAELDELSALLHRHERPTP